MIRYARGFGVSFQKFTLAVAKQVSIASLSPGRIDCAMTVFFIGKPAGHGRRRWQKSTDCCRLSLNAREFLTDWTHRV
jgi:hypothetical protein